MLKKTLALILSCVIAAGMLTGCVGKKEDAKPKKQSTESVEFEEEKGPVVATVIDEKIMAERFEYFLMFSMYSDAMTAQSQTNEDGTPVVITDDYWTEEKMSALADSAWEQTVNMTLYRALAKDRGIELTETEIDTVDQNIASGADYYGGEENFDLFFKAQGLSRGLFRSLSLDSFYSNKLYENYVDENSSDEEVMQMFKRDYVKAKHILITNTDAETGEDVTEAAHAKIQDIKAQLDGGADFDSLMTQYNEDPGMASAPEGYVFTTGEMVPEFEQAAFALEVGQVSDIVETSYGYHILKKVELTDADINGTTTDMYGNSMTYRDAIESSAFAQEFQTFVDAEKEKITIDIVQEEYDKIVSGAVAKYSEFAAGVDEASQKLNEIMSANTGTTGDVAAE